MSEDQYTQQDPTRQHGQQQGQPAQQQSAPGSEQQMGPKPDHGEQTYRAIGRAVAIAYAREGADVLISYLGDEEEADARDRVFKTNVYAMFWLCKLAVPHLPEGSAIINTSSIQAFNPSPQLLDYATTKAAIANFTKALALNLADQGIRVNAVAPGPVWTPLIPATIPEEKVKTFGTDVPMGRPGQPAELAPAYVFFASQESSYVTGEILG